MGTVLGPDKLPLEGAVLQLSGPNERKTEADATGFFGFVDLPPGTYQLRASSGQLDFRTSSSEAGAGKTIVRNFHLAPAPGEDF